MRTLNEMIEAQDAWSRRNFPDRRADHAVLGLIEELGELCLAIEPDPSLPEAYGQVVDMMRYLGKLAHINLKRAQGIRKASTTEEHELDAIDQLGRAFEEYYTLVGYPPSMFAQAPELEPSEADERDALGDLVIYAMDRANRKGYDLEEIVEQTLESVLKRDFVKNPATGKVA